jgi:hypothetical protein
MSLLLVFVIFCTQELAKNAYDFVPLILVCYLRILYGAGSGRVFF